MPTITISADAPPPTAPLPDETYATEAQKQAVRALAAAKSAGASRDAVEALLAQAGDNASFISADADNRLKRGGDGGLHVKDDFSPDPLVHYLLSRGNL